MAQMSMASLIEPYRKGTSFSDWVDRLEYCFLANDINEESRKAHFITLSGPFVYAELKLLFPLDNLNTILYGDMIKKLKSRFDKTPSGLVQRVRFSQRVQHPDETLEDYVLAIKLQAEFCSFGTFKDQAIRDRIISGIGDIHLQQKLLNEDEELGAEATEKLIITWEMAKSNAKSLGIGRDTRISSFADTNLNSPTVQKIFKTYEAANGSNQSPSYPRGPVRSRLGYKPYFRNEQNKDRKYNNIKPAEWRKGQLAQKHKMQNIICDFCGVRGHIKKKCFKLKNIMRGSKFVDDWKKPGPSQSKNIEEIFSQLRTNDSDSDDDKDIDWKRAGYGPSKTNKSG
ncbi:uncharacterized protein LOC129734011 [Wyeomyia smithii]|uniref:uncharacterized protein LOC129734011 n=1 Tax=Wyeomyia smithii TaxID=174621 RepID=UPI00246804A9|nr:uncharacterized protein LOC129734011 [Wyeomyia smithii]